jgi:hypothetical protein
MDTTTMALLTGLLSVVLGLGVVAAALGGAYFYGKERGRKEAGALLKAGSATAEMVERTERALDALAIEVERVGEAQRHAAKMLAKQADKEPQPR